MVHEYARKTTPRAKKHRSSLRTTTKNILANSRHHYASTCTPTFLSGRETNVACMNKTVRHTSTSARTDDIQTPLFPRLNSSLSSSVLSCLAGPRCKPVLNFLRHGPTPCRSSSLPHGCLASASSFLVRWPCASAPSLSSALMPTPPVSYVRCIDVQMYRCIDVQMHRCIDV